MSSLSKKTVLLVFGTRPEAIKMCPLVKELKNRAGLNVKVCVTGQHRQMLDVVLEEFGVVPDFDLHVMKQGQTLFDVTTAVLNGLDGVLISSSPTLCLSTVIQRRPSPPHLHASTRTFP